VRDDEGAEDGPREVAEKIRQQLPDVRARGVDQRQHCLFTQELSKHDMQQTLSRERLTSEATSGSRARVLSTSSLAFEAKYTIASRTPASMARIC
jgi:superfamily II helicase